MSMNCLVRQIKTNKDPYSKITLRGCFGRRVFPLSLQNVTGVTTADLARQVECVTGVVPSKQKLVFKGIVLDPPDCGPWAARLDTLTLLPGDMVHLVAPVDQLVADHKDTVTLEQGKVKVTQLDKQLSLLLARADGLLRGTIAFRGDPVMTLTKLRQDFESIQCVYREQTQILNGLTFDHRNCISQANRRHLVDHIERQMDKCTDLREGIFQRLALSHCMARQNRLYPTEARDVPAMGRVTRLPAIGRRC